MAWGQTVTKRSLDYLWGINNAWSGTTLTPYVTLSSTLPTVTATNITEPATGTNWNNYSPVHGQAFVNTTAASAGSVSNTSAITFPTPSSLGGFDAKYYVIYLSASSGTDGPTATNMVCFGTLTQELIANIGIAVVGAIGAFSLTITPGVSGMTAAGANTLLDVLSGRVAANTNFPANYLYLSAYTTLPTTSQTANTNEATGYTGYARVLTTSGTVAAATSATPAVVATSAQINFGICTAGSATIVGWGAGPISTGATALYFAGATTIAQAIGIGNQPYVASAVNLASLQ